MAEDLKILADENIAEAVVQQLVSKGVDATRLIDVLAEGTPDLDVLDYCYQNGFTLVTLD
jgi:predicted nuclease of predicted toxin-antitoxin system